MGRKTVRQIAVELNMCKYGSKIVLHWVKSYRANGHVIFDNKSINNKYSKEFKEMVVQGYLHGLGSIYDLAAEYGIPRNSTVFNWVNSYNSHRKFKVYMADILK